MMTPSQTLLSAASATAEVTDSRGRVIKLRRLTALDTLRLFKAAGPVLANNQPWLSMATLAMSVTDIDGIPLPVPTTEAQIEAAVERLMDEGLSAVADHLDAQDVQGQESIVSTAGNSPGTPI